MPADSATLLHIPSVMCRQLHQPHQSWSGLASLGKAAFQRHTSCPFQLESSEQRRRGTARISDLAQGYQVAHWTFFEVFYQCVHVHGGEGRHEWIEGDERHCKLAMRTAVQNGELKKNGGAGKALLPLWKNRNFRNSREVISISKVSQSLFVASGVGDTQVEVLRILHEIHIKVFPWQRSILCSIFLIWVYTTVHW